MSDLVVDREGRLHFKDRIFDCLLGRAGRSAAHREGDGATPIGIFPLRRILYRPDRIAPPRARLPVEAILPDDLWCDDPRHPDYNRLVRRPFAASHEVLWREDHLYDLIIVPGHNDDPPVPDLGSAIFIHLASFDRRPTQGCIALDGSALREIADQLQSGDRLNVKPA